MGRKKKKGNVNFREMKGFEEFVKQYNADSTPVAGMARLVHDSNKTYVLYNQDIFKCVGQLSSQFNNKRLRNKTLYRLVQKDGIQSFRFELIEVLNHYDKDKLMKLYAKYKEDMIPYINLNGTQNMPKFICTKYFKEHMTQKEIASMIGVSDGYISDIICKDSRYETGGRNVNGCYYPNDNGDLMDAQGNVRKRLTKVVKVKEQPQEEVQESMSIEQHIDNEDAYLGKELYINNGKVTPDCTVVIGSETVYTLSTELNGKKKVSESELDQLIAEGKIYTDRDKLVSDIYKQFVKQYGEDTLVKFMK